MKRRTLSSLALTLAALSVSSFAWADRVAVLPFTQEAMGASADPPAARNWTQKAVALRGHALPTDAEIAKAEAAVTDGVADTSEECRAAGRAAASDWTLFGRVQKIEVPASKAPDGGEDPGYDLVRIELEACRVQSGRVESLARDVDPDEAPSEIAEMLALLLRPEGIANADIPWRRAPRKRKAKPAPAAPPTPPSEPAPPPPAPEAPSPDHAYAEGHPFAAGISLGVTSLLEKPDQARGPSLGMPLGAVVAYALESVRGLELRGIVTSQVVGPRALVLAAGGRYAFPLLAKQRLFVGPEVLLGAHVALGADKTARFLTQGSAFAALGLGERVQLEIAGDLGAALGGSGALILGGGTVRALVRF